MAEQQQQTRTQFTRESILDDYRVAFRSRQASLIGRKEVLTGKAKFGIFGDGKEVAQLAMARAFRKGDWRSGYYRDQTFIFATGIGTLDEFFAQLYADTDVARDPWSGGRGMNAHFGSRLLEPDGSTYSSRSLATVANFFTRKTAPAISPPRSAIQQRSRAGSRCSMNSPTIFATSASKRSS